MSGALRYVRRCERLSLIGMIVLFLVGAFVSSAAHAQTASTDEQQILELQQKYRNAVDTLDPKLIDEIWSHDTPVSFIHPLGTDEGFEAIQSDIFGKTMGLFSKRDLLFNTAAVHVYCDSAWSEVTWTFHAVWKDSGESITTQGRETQIFLRENGVWRLVHVHYSGLPVAVAKKGV
jgi:hypothetical protein